MNCRDALVASVRDILLEWDTEGDMPWGILLSGGTDTCAVVEALSLLERLPAVAFTVYMKDSPSTDRPYAQAAANKFGIEHVELELSAEELLGDPLAFCIEHLKSFDPMELRNSVVVAAAILQAHKQGIRCLLTGDGSDELMGGYSFTWKSEEPEWTEKRDAMCREWFFSAPVLGKAIGDMKIRSPFTSESFSNWAISNLHKIDCIASAKFEKVPNGVKSYGAIGKTPLRDAFPESLAAWRHKDPIEVGSGTTIFRSPFWFKDNIVKLPDEEFLSVQRKILEEDSIVIRDHEHYYYYMVFKKLSPANLPKREIGGSNNCIGCHFELYNQTTLFCRVCGCWPARKIE